MHCSVVNCMCRSWMNWVVKWRDGSYRGGAMTHCMVWRCVKRSNCMMRESCVSCRVGHNWCWVGTNDWGMSGVMWCDCSVVRRGVRGQHWGVMNCMMGSGWGMMGGNSCKVSCMMGSSDCMLS